MTITKKDAEDLADVLRDTGKFRVLSTPEQIKREIAEGIAEVGKRSNPRFNRRKFLEACGIRFKDDKNGPAK